MNLDHLQNYLIPDLPVIVFNHLKENESEIKYFFDLKFNTDELLKFLADNFDPNIDKSKYVQVHLLKEIYRYLKEKGIYYE